MTEIKFRTPEVIEAEERARKASLQQAFAPQRPVQPPLVLEPVVPSWNEVTVPVITPVAPGAPVVPIETVAEPQPQPEPTILAAELQVTDEGALVAPTTVSINLSVPTLKLPKLSPEQAERLKTIVLKLKTGAVTGFRTAQPQLKQLAQKAQSTARTLPKRQVALAGAGVALSLSLLIGGNHLWQTHSKQRQAALVAAAAAKVANNKITVKPKFAPVTPASKTDLAAGKAGQTAYDTQHGTFSYADTLDGHQLTVSQQPVPTKFKSAQEAVTSIAKDLKATQPILTKQGTAYAVTDAKSNSQTIVYSLNNLLIFINSPFTHQSSEWVNYLNNLKQN